MNWTELIGKKVVALRGWKEEYSHLLLKNKKTTYIPLSFILFDDEETYIQFTEQDPHDYHDCSSSARHLDLYKNKEQWGKMFNKEGNYDEPTDTDYPF